jgi:anti-sigma factor ChrR (cupin superfamily)
VSSSFTKPKCSRIEEIAGYALQATSSAEQADLHAHIEGCSDCREELASFVSVTRAFAAYGADLPYPSSSSSLWDEVAGRIASETGTERLPRARGTYVEPPWENVAAGIWCKLLATDKTRHRVSMLVRLEPNTEYPPHRHAGVEELHLLDGEIWINDRKLYPGDYNRAPPGTADKRVWSETGCTCVLITSTEDVLA